MADIVEKTGGLMLWATWVYINVEFPQPHVTDYCPAVPSRICFLLPDVFFSLCLALMVASLLETIFITNLLSSSGEFSPAPRWIRVLVLQFLGCLVCMPLKKKQTEGSGTVSA